MLGAISSYLDNIGACITIGAVAGLIGGLWLRVILPKITAN